MTLPGVCIALAFRQVVRLGASWPVLFTCLCLFTPQLLAASALLCPLSLFSRAHMEEHQNMRLPLGTTGWNHSYYTGNPHSALHSLQQLQAGASSPSLCRYRPPHGSHMVQRLQALCPAQKLNTVPSVHRFRRAPSALSQVTFCQPRSLRLPRSSPLPHSWSVAPL